MCDLSCLLDQLLSAVGVVSDILSHRTHEESRLLTHQAYLLPQTVEIELFDVFVVDQNLTFLRVVEAH